MKEQIKQEIEKCKVLLKRCNTLRNKEQLPFLKGKIEGLNFTLNLLEKNNVQ